MQKHIVDLFEPEEVLIIKNLIDSEKAKRETFVWNEHAREPFPQEMMDSPAHMIQNTSLGKIMFNLTFPDFVKDKLIDAAKKMGLEVEYFCATYTEYSSKYGKPVLTPHKDSQDFCLIDYQLDANTSWPLVIEENIYDLSNNDALIFLPSRLTHSRQDKVFVDDEYVKMIFFDMKLVNK